MKCEGCGGLFFLGKRLGGPEYYLLDYGKGPLDKRLNEFYSEHAFCTGETAESKYNPDHFRIVYEMDEDFT